MEESCVTVSIHFLPLSREVNQAEKAFVCGPLECLLMCNMSHTYLCIPVL